MRRRAIAIGTAGFAASAVLVVLALVDVERTTMSYLAALAWIIGTGAALVALLLGQRKSLRGQAEIQSRLVSLVGTDDDRRSLTLEGLERQFESAVQTAVEQAVVESNAAAQAAVHQASDATVWAIDARLVAIAEQFLDRRDDASTHGASS